MSVKAIKTKTIAPKFERTNLKYDVDYDTSRKACVWEEGRP